MDLLQKWNSSNGQTGYVSCLNKLKCELLLGDRLLLNIKSTIFELYSIWEQVCKKSILSVKNGTGIWENVRLPEEKKECNGYDLKILPGNRPINNHSKHTCLLGAAGNWLLCGRSITWSQGSHLHYILRVSCIFR